MLPAREYLEPDQCPAAQRDNGLEIGNELCLFEGTTNV